MSRLPELAHMLDALRDRPFLTSQSGSFLRTPDGNVEDVAEMAAAGMRWVGANLGDHDPSAWNLVRQRAAAAGVEVFPWARLAHPDHGETIEHAKAKLSKLVAAGKVWGSRAIIPNLEKEAESVAAPPLVRAHLDTLEWDGEVAWSLLGWLPNAVDFAPIEQDPCLLQIFYTDMHRDPSEVPVLVSSCTYHARDKGFTYVGVTFQTYAGAQPPEFEGTRSYFTGDDIKAGNWHKWAP